MPKILFEGKELSIGQTVTLDGIEYTLTDIQGRDYAILTAAIVIPTDEEPVMLIREFSGSQIFKVQLTVLRHRQLENREYTIGHGLKRSLTSCVYSIGSVITKTKFS